MKNKIKAYLLYDIYEDPMGEFIGKFYSITALQGAIMSRTEDTDGECNCVYTEVLE